MQFLTLIYTDPERLAELPAEEFDRLMRGCFEKADALRVRGEGCCQGRRWPRYSSGASMWIEPWNRCWRIRRIRI